MELELESRVVCKPGLEVEIELAAPLALARGVGDEDLDHVILDHIGNAAPAVEEVAEVGAEGWIGGGERARRGIAPCMIADSGSKAHSRRLPRTTLPKPFSSPHARQGRTGGRESPAGLSHKVSKPHFSDAATGGRESRYLAEAADPPPPTLTRYEQKSKPPPGSPLGRRQKRLAAGSNRGAEQRFLP